MTYKNSTKIDALKQKKYAHFTTLVVALPQYSQSFKLQQCLCFLFRLQDCIQEAA